MSARLWSLNQPEDLRPKKESVALKLTLWGLFTVAVSIVPIAFIFLTTISHGGQPEPVGPSDFDIQMSHAAIYQQALGRGELLLIAAAIAAGGVGEVVARGSHRRREHQLAAAGSGLLLVSACSLWFADISASIARREEVELDLVSWGSIVMFLVSVVTAGACTLMAET